MQRYAELDSLRGLAAFSVLIGHCFAVTAYMSTNVYRTGTPLVNAIKFALNKTPLAVVWAGHNAVILFFVLSGFVLSLPYMRGTSSPYGTFLVRRLFRIYVPYLVAITFAIIVRLSVEVRPIPGYSAWFNDTQWSAPVTMGNIVQHIIFIGNYNYNTFDPVVWSLIQELRISLVFPILMLMVIRFRYRLNLLIGAVCSCVSYIAVFIQFHTNVSGIELYGLGFCSMFEWIPMFIVGALVAKNLSYMRMVYHRMVPFKRLLVVMSGLLLYTYSFWIPHLSKWVTFSLIEDWITTFAVMSFIVVALASVQISRALHWTWIAHLGRISFSLYLYHIVILYGLIHAFHSEMHIWQIWLVTLALSILVATIAYRYVEVPCINVGKRITHKMHRYHVESMATIQS